MTKYLFQFVLSGLGFFLYALAACKLAAAWREFHGRNRRTGSALPTRFFSERGMM